MKSELLDIWIHFQLRMVWNKETICHHCFSTLF